ncbi:hypothetical protein [Aquitalea magnusonii]|uniref:Uncharacterized protein n=1 Tax=Aquitalea magnusonii TaxID=332411 RepID=A0A318JRG4_9NEIS|nr:hypothetical protein [Aquitalea magnusonii]PXX51247.1 hypothetical protein DFR38_101309 [Aquitalea magnusonii]
MRILSRAVPLLLALSASVPAQAAMLAYVDDSVLDSLRGRYIDAGQIVRFGVQMLTTWQNQAGVVQGAGLQLTAQAGAVPVISRYTLNGDGTTAAVAAAPTSGLASVQGVVQLNQQAGNGNSSSNSTSIDIRRDGTASLQMPAGWQSSGSGTTLGSGQLSVSMDLGNAGRMGQLLGQGQLLQFASISGSGISTDNSLRIQLVLQPQSSGFSFSIPSRLMLSGSGVR